MEELEAKGRAGAKSPVSAERGPSGEKSGRKKKGAWRVGGIGKRGKGICGKRDIRCCEGTAYTRGEFGGKKRRRRS